MTLRTHATTSAATVCSLWNEEGLSIPQRPTRGTLVPPSAGHWSYRKWEEHGPEDTGSVHTQRCRELGEAMAQGRDCWLHPAYTGALSCTRHIPREPQACMLGWAVLCLLWNALPKLPSKTAELWRLHCVAVFPGESLDTQDWP